MERLYLVGYCSPKRSGDHLAAVEVVGATQQRPAGASFTADGFGPGCSAEYWAGACAGFECGGLGCGACDERFEVCLAVRGSAAVGAPVFDGTYVPPSYCDDACSHLGAGSSAECGGTTVTNANGIEQVCPDTLEHMACPGLGDQCIIASEDARACGSCDACPIAAGWGVHCVDGLCIDTCLTSYGADCDGSHDNACEVDLATDPAHCGECDRACTTCGAGGVPGACDAVLLTSPSSSVSQLQIVGDRIYFLSSGSIGSVGIDGSNPETFPMSFGVRAMAAGTERITYIRDNGNVQELRMRDLATGVDEILGQLAIPVQFDVRTLTVTPTHAIISTESNGTNGGRGPLFAVELPPPGQYLAGELPAVQLASAAENPRVAGSYLYWAEEGGHAWDGILVRAPVDALESRTIVARSWITPAVSDSHIYWTCRDGPSWTGENKGCRRTVGLGPVETVDAPLLGVGEAAGSILYGWNRAGLWVRYDTSGGGVEPIAFSLSQFVATPTAVVVVAPEGLVRIDF